MAVKVLSLFDGMACGMLAFQKAGISVDNYYAYEIDKYAIQTATHNFPQIQECGDVFNADFTKYSGIDYLIGGSPCTYWSIAQSPDKRETTASGIGWELFSQYVRALHEAEPKFFIYENNKSMAKAIRESITETFGFEPICINSALVSAQNRQRLYWVGKRNADGTYSKVDVQQPEDRGILLKDVLDGADLTNCDKAYCLTSSYDGACAWNTIERHQRSMVAEPVGTTKDGKAYCLSAGYSNGSGEPVRCFILPREDGVQTQSKQYRVYETSGKSTTLCAEGGGMGAKTGLYAIPIEFDGDIPIKAVSGADGKTNAITTVSKDNLIGEPVRCFILPREDGVQTQSQGYRVYETEGKSITLCAVGGGIGGGTGLYAIPVEFENGIPTKAISYADGKTYKVYEVKEGQITIKGKTYPIKLTDGYYIIRKLIVSECKRLQTVPEWYEFPVSDTQAYKMLGNGWTIDVIAHLIEASRQRVYS